MIVSKASLLVAFVALLTLGHAAPTPSDTVYLARRQNDNFGFSPTGVANPEAAPPTDADPQNSSNPRTTNGNHEPYTNHHPGYEEAYYQKAKYCD
ncbi:hypothetical protein D9756_006268 [Leucocoprinus leucothites]|uniref:Uncharacterized protein n=1 Tax=Leucocoprinus leucothites TaxID=201217 RepID=A0A8H5D4W9_9AGAR|nr:hypothetical protein D9756_006268 [Leucoagaricus leucothites]